jgi:hypothetical protein
MRCDFSVGQVWNPQSGHNFSSGRRWADALCSGRGELTRVQRLSVQFSGWAQFSSASAVGQTRLVALTPFFPLSREAGEGGYGVRKRSFRPMLKLTLQHSKSVGAQIPSPTLWEMGWG